MLNRITAIAIKDTINRFSSRSQLLFFIILPILFTVLLSGGIGGGANNSESGDNRLSLLVVDQDNSEQAANFIAVLTASDTAKVELQSLADAETAFADEAAPVLLIIPGGFGESLLAGETAVVDMRQAPNDLNVTVVEQAIQNAIGQVSRPLIAARRSLDEAERTAPFTADTVKRAYYTEGLTLAQNKLADAPQRIVTTRPETAPEAANSFNVTAYQSIGQLISWVFIPLLGISGLFAYERTNGTMRRLLITPTRRSTFLLGTISGQLATALVQMALLIGFGILVMKVNWGQAPLALVVMLFAFGLASVALGTMLGTFVRTDSQASNISIMLGMSMSLLGGCWFPLEVFPPAVQQAAKILPTTWAMQGLTDLVMRGQGLIDILPIAAVLLIFAAIYFVIGVMRFRYE